MTWTSDVARRLQLVGCAAFALTLLVGCPRDAWPVRVPFSPRPCVLPENISKEELVEHLNRNRAPLTAWRSTDVVFRVPGPAGVPVRLTADLAVEEPRNFRLIAKSLRGNEADLGSNSERFWFWFRQDPSKQVITASHADGPLVFDRMQIPFQPEWLMQALGLGQLDPTEFDIYHHEPGSGRVTLIAQRGQREGQVFEHHLTVDTCAGHIIEQTLYDAHRQPVARAVLENFREHHGVSMPHHIELHSPRTQQHMTMSIGDIVLNPIGEHHVMWQFPNVQNAIVRDIGHEIRTRGGIPREAIPRQEGYPREINVPHGLENWERPVFHETGQQQPDSPAFADELEEPPFADEGPFSRQSPFE